MKFLNKNLIVVAIAFIVISLTPKTTNAQMAVFDAAVEFNTGMMVGSLDIMAGSMIPSSIATASMTTAQKVQQVMEWLFKVATEVLKRKLLGMITDQIVNWIQGGGKPQFITDFSGFLKDAADQAAGTFIEAAIPRLCKPFQFNLRLAFTPIEKFNRVTCTLTGVKENFSNFKEIFKNGDWLTWDDMALKPQNNIYGAYLETWDRFEIEKAQATQSSLAEAQAGRGFLSVRVCKAYKQPEYNSCLSQGGGKDGCAKSYCAVWQTQTPGSVIADMATKAVTWEIDGIISAQDLAPYIAAIANAAINRVMEKGLLEMKSALYGDIELANFGSNAEQICSGLIGTPAYDNCTAAAQGGAPVAVSPEEQQKSDIITLLDQDLVNQNKLLNAKKSTYEAQNKTIDILNELINNSCPIFTMEADASAITPLADTLVKFQENLADTFDQIAAISSRIIYLEKLRDNVLVIAPSINSTIPPDAVSAFTPNDTTPTTAEVLAAIWTDVNKNVKPSISLSLSTAEGRKLKLIQQEMDYYFKQLFTCKSPELVFDNLVKQLELLKQQLDMYLLIKLIQEDFQPNTADTATGGGAQTAKDTLIARTDRDQKGRICTKHSWKNTLSGGVSNNVAWDELYYRTLTNSHFLSSNSVSNMERGGITYGEMFARPGGVNADICNFTHVWDSTGLSLWTDGFINSAIQSMTSAELWRSLTVWITVIQEDIAAKQAELDAIKAEYDALITTPMAQRIELYKQMDDIRQQLRDLRDQMVKMKETYPAALGEKTIPDVGTLIDISVLPEQLLQKSITDLKDSITSAQGTYNTAIEGNQHGQYVPGSKAILQTAINAAIAVRDGGSTNRTTIEQARYTLLAAVNTFEASKIPIPNTAALENAITLANDTYSTAVEGTNPGEYESGSKAVFQAAIAAAVLVRDSDTSTQTDVNSAYTALSAALNSFAAKRVPYTYY